MNNLNESNIALIFDLDYTIWPFWVDTHIKPPFTKESENLIKDAYNYKIQLYKDVKEIFKKLKERGYLLCSISRTWEPEYAKQLIKMFNLKNI
jgi:magnesium-dependent phosphatase 1